MNKILNLQDIKGVRDGVSFESPLSKTSAEYLLFITVLIVGSEEATFAGVNGDPKSATLLENTLFKSAKAVAEIELEALKTESTLFDKEVAVEFGLSIGSLIPEN